MNANAPAMIEKLKALNGELLRIGKAGVEPKKSGGIVMQTVHFDDDIFEVIRVWSQDTDQSNLITSKRGAIFVVVKGKWAVKLQDQQEIIDSTVVIPKCIPFTLEAAEVGSIGLLIVS